MDTVLESAISLAHKASESDRKHQYEDALSLYTQSLEYWRLACKYQADQQTQRMLVDKMNEYVTRAEKIRDYLIKANRIPAGQQNADSGGDSDLSAEDDKLEKSIMAEASITKPSVSWSDVAGLEAAKECLQEAVTLPSKFPILFKHELKPWRGILLYGPPGTGKTHLARACAGECQATFLSVSAADLFSKWQGESEKTVKALFKAARKHRPAVIFIDEVDSICCARSGQDTDSSRRVKTEFLVQMQGLHADGCPNDILVLGATNVPWELDPAVRRRFERRIFVPLPNLQSRKRLFQIHLGKSPRDVQEHQIDSLARMTDGCSGADISVVVRDALFQPLRKCRLATHFKREGAGWAPCRPSDQNPTKECRSLMTIPSAELQPPPLTMADLQVALSTAKPSVAKEDLKRYEDWTSKFGNFRSDN